MQDPSKKESDVIKRIFEPLTHIGHSKAPNLPLRSNVHFVKRMRKPLTFGLTDDCASITPPDNKEMVVTKDILVEGVHFIGSENPKDIAKKALRVNLRLHALRLGRDRLSRDHGTGGAGLSPRRRVHRPSRRHRRLRGHRIRHRTIVPPRPRHAARQ